MHPLKLIRETPELFDAGLAKRGLEPHSAKLLALDEEKRKLQTEMQQLQQQRNQLAKDIGQRKAKKEDATEQMEQAKAVNERLAALEAAAKDDSALTALLATLPNLPAPEVPVGKDEADNKELRKWGTPPSFAFTPKQHFELGEALGLMDFEQTAKLSGSRFVTLHGPLARLERALSVFMLDIHTREYGYTEVSPPLLVRDDALFGTGQLPKFAEDAFRTTNDYWLISTAEVSLTNLVRERILEESELPLRMTALTPCFRSEAGSAGKDTRGMLRQHQFYKVELVSITTPEQSETEHERMTGIAEEVLKRLKLPYRVMLLCSGDMGFSARKTYDLEVWLPGQNTYRELSSCSNCGDFQAQRMKARYRPSAGKETIPVHTLNGSALAVGRTLIAVLENYQQADGSIIVPEALRPYMGGIEQIG